MFQLVLIFVLFATVLISLTAWSLHLRRGLVVPTEARRVLVALERATLAAVRRRALRIPMAAGACLGLLMTAQQLLPGNSVSAFAVLGVITTYCLGVFAILALSWLCGHHTKKHAFLSIASASVSQERSLSVAISSVGLLSVAAEVFGAFSAAIVHAAVVWIAHLDSGLSSEATRVLPIRISAYFGIGAVIASLALQQAGSVCVGASKLAGDLAFDRRTSLPSSDPRNPSVLSDAMACQLGSIVPKMLDAFTGGALVSAISFQLASIAATSTGPSGTAAIAMLPLLVRAFGLFATLVALLTLRTSEHEDQRQPLIRSQLVAYVVLGSALAGLIVWLLDSLNFTYALAALAGLLLAPALGKLRAYLLARPRATRNANEDGQRPGSSLAALESSVAGLGAMLGPLLLYTCVLGLLCIWLGHSVRLDLQHLAVLLLGLAVPSSLSALNQIPGTCRDFAAIGALAATIGRVPLSDAAQLRLRRNAEAFDRVSVASNPASSDGGALICGLAAVICQVTHLGAPTSSTSVVLLICIGLLVVIPSALAAFECLRASSKATRTQLNEVDRQLRGMRRDGAFVLVPEDFVPSYRSCVELLARDSAQGGLLFAVAVVVFPALAAYLGRIPENSAGSTSLTLASYAAIAAAVGLFATHVGHAASAANLLAPRGNSLPRAALTSPSVPVSESLRTIEFLGHSVSVSVPLLTKAVALVTLVFSASLV